VSAGAAIDAALEREQLVEQLTTELLDALARFARQLVEQREAYLERHRLIDAAAAATLLNVKLSWVRRKTSEGGIPSVQLGGLVRYHPPTLIAWALSHQEVPDELETR